MVGRLSQNTREDRKIAEKKPRCNPKLLTFLLLLPLLLGLSSCLEAFHTDLDAFGCTIDHLFYVAQVGKENPFGGIKRVRSCVTRVGMFAAYFACFGHVSSVYLFLVFLK